MYVGAAISELVDKPDNRLKFEGEDMKTTEASWYLTLTKVKDIAGSISGLKPATKGRSATTTAIRPVNKQPAKLNGKQTMLKHKAPARQTISKAQTSIPSSLRIVELNDDKLEADLTPYAKPDSDPEDDSPDPTLVNLNRSTAPIYIRDLLSTIADTENIDRATLALRTAPSLIRRKANFGTEVSDHIEELATTIANLHDAEHFDFDGGGEEFARMRQKALQAVLVADPKRMGTWFARAITGVGGDYSISQRIALLAAMGLGGREIAGFKDEDDEDQQMANAFPSKKLKGKMHDIWAGSPSTSSANLGSSGPTKPLLLSKGDSSAVNSVAQRVSRTMLEPMALSAADTLTGPDVLKVRKFSSRMDVEARRKKPVSNELSKIITEAFFFPLMGMFGAGVQTL